MSLTECCWNPVLEYYVTEMTTKRERERDRVKLRLVERAAELCREDRIVVTFIEGKRYVSITDDDSIGCTVEREIEEYKRRLNKKFIWREYELLSVTELFRHLRTNVFAARLCVTDFFLAPYVERALLNCRFRITRCMTRNVASNRYTDVKSELWQTEAYRESLGWHGKRYVIRNGKVVPNPTLSLKYAKEDYVLKTYYTNDALFVLSRTDGKGFDEVYEYDDYGSIKVINCKHCDSLRK